MRQRTLHLDDIRAAFDVLADSWDAAHGPASASGRKFAMRLAYLRATCQRLAPFRVLDIGCGTGLYLFGLTDLISEGVGIDLSPKMIDRAQAMAIVRDPERKLRFAVAAAEELSPDAIGRFDLVLMVGTLEHLLVPERALSAVRQMLAREGEIVVIMRHPWHPMALIQRLFGRSGRIPPHRHLTPRQLTGVARCAGLELAAVSSLDGFTRSIWRPGRRRPQRIHRLLWPSLTYAAHLVSPRGQSPSEAGAVRSWKLDATCSCTWPPMTTA